MSGLADIARHLRENKFIRMLGYFRPFLGLIALAMVMAGFVNGAELVSPYIMKIAIDDYILGDGTGMSIAFIGILYFASVLVGAVSNYAHVILLNTIVQKIIHSIRMQLFSHI
jgi:ATP-binding cassette subfamily B protein